MSKMIQIRHVPDELHRKLKARAAEAGMTLSDYLLKVLERSAAYPTPEELLRRLRQYPPADFEDDSVAVIRRLRDAE
jgi:plasmid stability protein